MQRIVECVPNISEGRNAEVYNAVAAEVTHVAIHGADGVPAGRVRLLDVDPGADTNRTVISFAGEPEAVLAAALRVAARAFELIDMRSHRGAHPRHGAVDVLPFVPVSGVTMEDCVTLANRAGQALGEMGVPVYLYEHAATSAERRNLSDLRLGEYEAIPAKLADSRWKPDYGPAQFSDAVARTGVCTVGARQFLIAYNINFNTSSVKLVSDIALTIRERGRIARTADGRFQRDASGEPVYQPGMFQHCKAMGWYIPEYQCAQLTMNLTDFEATPIHEVFDAVCDLAAERGLRVTGSELVGLIPQAALHEAGRYFLDRQREVCTGVPESELLRVAVRSLGLAELAPFDPGRRVIEYALAGSPEEQRAARPLVHMTLARFADELADSTPAPGGGSVAALAGALAAGLAAMVPNLTVGKKGYKAVRREMNDVACEAQALKDEYLRLIDDDTHAFNALLESFRMPKGTPEDEAAREQAIAQATQGTIDVPLKTLRHSVRTAELCLICAERGNRNTLSDALAGAAMAAACAEGAHGNVLINALGLPDQAAANELRSRADALLEQTRELLEQVRAAVMPVLRPQQQAAE